MNKKFVALGVGLFALFLAICGGAYYLGTQNDLSEDSIGTAFIEAVDTVIGGDSFSSLDSVDTTAQEMRLQEFSGILTLTNGGAGKTPVAGSRLVSGDSMETQTESMAYVTLDQSKILRMNQNSQMEIRQLGQDLDVFLSYGSVFFNVTSPLSIEETLEFHTNNVVTGVRGTAGVVSATEKFSQVAVLTGTVFCATTTGESFYIEAGQVAIVTTHEDGTVTYEILSLEEDDLYFYFSDDFIDPIQGDLNNEGNSVPLSETLRKPLETKTSGKVLALSNTIAIEDNNGNLLTFENSGGQTWDGVTLGGMVDLSYVEGRVISMTQTSQGADVVGAYFNAYLHDPHPQYSSNSTPYGQWVMEEGTIYFYNLDGATNLSQAEKEAFVLRMKEGYVGEADVRLGNWSDLEATATTPLIPVEQGADYYENRGFMNLSIHTSYPATESQFTINYGIWTGYFYECILNPATGQYSFEYIGGVS